jgi:transcriptional regulator with XRE-family HTH domain
MNAEQIKNTRTRLKLSQEDLAERIGVSVRTLQRIEKGESEPRYDVRNKLAEVLCLEPIESEVERQPVDNLQILHWINFSTLAYLVIPLANLLLPLMLYHTKGRQFDKDSRTIARRVLWVQLAWSVLAYGFLITSVLSKILHYSTFAYSLTIAMVLYWPLNWLIILYWFYRIRRVGPKLVLA